MATKTLPNIKLSGVIDVRSIADSYEKIKHAVDAKRGVVIDLAGVTGLDLTLLQLIESARRTAALGGTVVRLAAPATGLVRETLERAGFLSDPLGEASQFWLGAKK